jgi:hypothetical protein
MVSWIRNRYLDQKVESKGQGTWVYEQLLHELGLRRSECLRGFRWSGPGFENRLLRPFHARIFREDDQEWTLRTSIGD